MIIEFQNHSNLRGLQNTFDSDFFCFPFVIIICLIRDLLKNIDAKDFAIVESITPRN